MVLKNKNIEIVENKFNLKMADNNALIQWLRDRDVSQPLNNVDLMAFLNASQYIQNHVAIADEVLALIYISTPLFLFLIMIENFMLIKNRIKI